MCNTQVDSGNHVLHDLNIDDSSLNLLDLSKFHIHIYPGCPELVTITR